jgi:hypothetical protein
MASKVFENSLPWNSHSIHRMPPSCCAYKNRQYKEGAVHHRSKSRTMLMHASPYFSSMLQRPEMQTSTAVTILAFNLRVEFPLSWSITANFTASSLWLWSKTLGHLWTATHNLCAPFWLFGRICGTVPIEYHPPQTLASKLPRVLKSEFFPKLKLILILMYVTCMYVTP